MQGGFLGGNVSFLVFLCVILSAGLHAGWNAIIKLGVSKQQSMLLLSVGHVFFSLPVAVYFGLPPAEIWPWLLASAGIHVAYQLFLAYAYEQGDISRVYPISRGTAPLIVLLVSSTFMSERLSVQEIMGVVVLGFGIFLMARGVFSSGESRRLLPFALGAAVATAAYSLVDGLGAREWANAVAYVAWAMILSGIAFVPAVALLKGSEVFDVSRRALAFGLLAAAMSLLAYGVVVWAMTQAPIALVTALRETSIFFAVLIGWLFFGDKMDRLKVASAVLIVAGALLTRL